MFAGDTLNNKHGLWKIIEPPNQQYIFLISRLKGYKAFEILVILSLESETRQEQSAGFANAFVLTVFIFVLFHFNLFSSLFN